MKKRKGEEWHHSEEVKYCKNTWSGAEKVIIWASVG